MFYCKHNEIITSNPKKIIGEVCEETVSPETTGSRLISEVKHRRAWVVLGWVTTWEVRVL